MITWSLWVVFVWWSSLAVNDFYQFIKNEDSEILLSNVVFMYLIVPAPIILLDYLLG